MLAADVDNIANASTVVLIVLSTTLIALFVFWMRRQEQRQKPALIPNSLWKKTSFTTICLLILLSNAVVNRMELFSSLLCVPLPRFKCKLLTIFRSFQEVQGDTALTTSLKILPNMILGIVTNFTTGLLVNKVPAIHAVLVTSALCALSPLLMSIIDPSWPYWYDAFFAQVGF